MPAELTRKRAERLWLSAIVPSHDSDRWLPEALHDERANPRLRARLAGAL
jgi:hypothetical protein